jgi:hypothetical protein
MKNIITGTSLAFLFSLCAGHIQAQHTYTPRPGTAERTAILDSVRFPLEAAVNQSVVFVVDHMKVQGDWAFLIATQQKRSGGKIDYRGTKYELYENECTCALVRRRGDTWVVVDSVYFMSDVWWWELWDRVPGAPRAIFPGN